jgi:hypothetical protein
MTASESRFPSRLLLLSLNARFMALQLDFQQTPYGWRAYFVGGDGVRANKAYFIPGSGFTTRSESNLQVRGRFMRPRERMKQTKDRWVEKLLKYHERPHHTRLVALEARVDALRMKLGERE